MNNHPSSSHKISNIFFASILAAAGIYGIAISIESVSAGDLVPGLITFAIVAIAIAATFIFHIPSYFGSHFSTTTISLLAIAVSVLGLVLTIADTATFVRLPEDMMTRPGIQSQRLVSILGIVCFSTALIINVVAAIAVPRQSTEKS